jgi:CheY-like chemotaxis protein
MKILWFDDEADILYLCRTVLSRHGYEVFTSSDCSQLFDMISTVKPDVIVMDYHMPGINGLEATQQIKQSDYGSIPVVCCTANTEIAKEAKEAGVDAFLNKPFSTQDLEYFIRKLAPNEPHHMR